MATHVPETFDPFLHGDADASSRSLSTYFLRDEAVNNPTGGPSDELHGSMTDPGELDCKGPLLGELHDLKSNIALRTHGHEATLRRSFSPIAALGLGFSITNSWVGYISCFGQNLAYGGPQNVVFGLLGAVFAQWTITLGLSEVASCYPSSGGQYHFVFILAPRRYKRFAAFVVGWMNLLAWSIGACSGVAVVVASISGMTRFWNETQQVTQLQLYMLYLIIAVLTPLPLSLGSRIVPKVLQINMVVSLVGFLVTFCVVILLRLHTQPASFVTTSHLGTTGWGIGPAWLMGICNAMYPFAGTDAVIHIAEEVNHPEWTLPLVMNSTLMIGFSTAFPLLLAMMFGMTDMNAVIKSQFPAAELVYQITGSKLVTIFIICCVTFILFSALTGTWLTTGRLAWAFARDHGLPYSTYFSHVSESYGFPVRSTLLCIAFSSIYGLLYIISTTAFNSILTSTVLCFNITYAIPQILVLLRGRSRILPRRSFNLGRLGYLCNILSPLLVVIMTIVVCLPPQLPVTDRNFNYTPVALVILVSVILGMWYLGPGKRFEGPKIDWDVLENVKITQ